MKRFLPVILVAGLIFSANASENLTLVKVKELGIMKNKVVFQSNKVKRIKGSNVVKGKLIAQWGIHVFEVVQGLYVCNSKNICRLNDYERIATFESCTIKKQTAKCNKKISGDDTSISADRDITVFPDGPLDEYGNNSRESIDEISDEFGSSINAEADII